MSSTPSSSATHTTLILPFLPGIYANPAPLLPTIYRTVSSLSSSTTSFLVLFSTPTNHGSQLYPALRQDAVANWSGFQTFLGKVYACLAAAQWTSERVLLDVEVGFVGDSVPLRRQKPKAATGDIIVLEGYEDLPTGDLVKTPSSETTTIPSPPIPSTSNTLDTSLKSTASSSRPPVVALGGTFDHLHAAHKLLLHLALFLAARKLIVGVMSDSLLSTKIHAPLVQPLGKRVTEIEDFLSRHGARRLSKEPEANTDTEDEAEGQAEEEVTPDPGSESVVMDVVEIMDPYGPTSWDPDIQALVVSQETLAGGKSVNKRRREKELPELELFVINVIASKLVEGEEGKDKEKDEETGKLRREGVVQEDEAGVEGEDVDAESQGRIKIRAGEGDDVRTLDLSGEMDEKKLKDLKMGSTAIRQWIAERQPGSARSAHRDGEER